MAKEQKNKKDIGKIATKIMAIIILLLWHNKDNNKSKKR